MEFEWVNPGLTRCTHGYVSFAAKPQPNRRIIGKTMTAPRRQRKLRLVGLGTGLLAAAAAISGLAAPAAIQAATTELIVVDRNSGIAIGGFDPVAYFIDRVAMPGKGDFEASFAGAVWRFRNEGNRGAFMADPDIYMPRFGGYDPIGVARGVAVAGDPRLWTLSGERLYLFSTPEDRDRFAGDAERVIATAERKWPSVKLTLAP
jgi:hypothetical protein